MTCFNPKYAWFEYIKEKGILKKKVHLGTKSEYRKLFNERNNMIIPCGKCIGCKLDKASEWATRSVIESKNWKNNCFITLTYNNAHIPHNDIGKTTLLKRDVQLFMKRLKRNYPGIETRIWKNEEENPIRQFICGEYGPTGTHRPHYHIGIFNWKPSDLKPFKTNKYGDIMYTSKEVEECWSDRYGKQKGFCIVEDMNYETACYIARYSMKKLHKTKQDYKNSSKEPEFLLTSRKGGLGYQAIENKAEFEKMKRNFGFFQKTKKGIKLKKIPTFLRNKWKEIDRIEYFMESDNRRIEMENAVQEKMKKTDLTYEEYIKNQKEKLKEKLKNSKTLKRNRIEETQQAEVRQGELERPLT